jgi:hypothetical protein
MYYTKNKMDSILERWNEFFRLLLTYNSSGNISPPKLIIYPNYSALKLYITNRADKRALKFDALLNQSLNKRFFMVLEGNR